MIIFKSSPILLLTSLLCTTVARADVRLPRIFGDHMVLQQGQTIPIWGWADAGEEVSIALGAQSAKTTAGADGKWRIDLKKIAANSKPQTLTVTGRNTVQFSDVLVGEVWLCSGQSNMEYGIWNLQNVPGLKYNSQVRVFHVTKAASLTPMDNTTVIPKELVYDTLSGYWATDAKPGSWNGFSAVGWIFGQRIHEITGNPVGMIGSYWGGTPAQAWTSLEGLEKNPALSHYAKDVQEMDNGQRAQYPVLWSNYVAALRKWEWEVWEPYGAATRQWEADAKKARDAGLPEPPKPQPKRERPANPGNIGTPTTLFNGMINPLIPYAIEGAIWYQGESNAWNPGEYATLFPNMIQDWRSHWGQGDFPFYFVQLAGYGVSPTDAAYHRWPLLRESQSAALKLPKTGMATAMDLGDANDIHPKNKVDVAKRLALLAENRDYSHPVVDSGPTFASLAVEGAKIRVQYTSIGSGLIIAPMPVLPGTAPNPQPTELTGFEIAGADQKWQPAKAVIDGNTVLVSSDAVPIPAAVRYAWADYPNGGLYNKEGLPAFPFRSKNWN